MWRAHPQANIPPEISQPFPCGPWRKSRRLCQPHLEGLKLEHGRSGRAGNKDFLIAILESVMRV